MPTTQEEATKILKISQEYMPLRKMTELFTRLDDEVGRNTSNDSLKQSLAMMKQLVQTVDPKEQLVSRRTFWSNWFK